MHGKELILADWATALAPTYYPYPPAVRPHLFMGLGTFFMGLGKFVMGRIHQTHSGKSYLVVHHSWDTTDPDTSCPFCYKAPQSFKHAILSCPSTAPHRSRLLQGVSDLGPKSPLCSDKQILLD